MLGSSFLDIAIGIVFIFLLLSLVASTIKELIASLMSLRGKELLSGLQTLLNDTDTNVNGLVARIYNHGEIFGLFKGDFSAETPRNLPSYIPAKNFVMAILGVLPAAAAALPAAPAPAPTAPAGLDPSLVPLWNAAKTLAGNTQTEKTGIPLLSMIEAATGLDSLKTSVEEWYNSAMDRVSGYYKYYNQWILFWIGVVLAIALNANTIDIVQQLSRNPTLRESVVAAAQSAEKKSAQGSTPAPGKTPKDVSDQIKEVQDLGIPLGWHPATPLKKDEKITRDWVWQQATAALERPTTYVGWLLTAIAVSLGAPFWFDILNKFMVVRSTVKPGEKSPAGRRK